MASASIYAVLFTSVLIRPEQNPDNGRVFDTCQMSSTRASSRVKNTACLSTQVFPVARRNFKQWTSKTLVFNETIE